MHLKTTIIGGSLALLGGAAVVMVADRQGWLRQEASQEADHTGGPQALRPSLAAALPRREPQVTIIPASSVRESAVAPAIPRAQRPPSTICTNSERAIQFEDPSIAALSGIRWRPLAESPVTHVISCNAETAFNGDRLAHVSSRAPGIVQQVIKRAGDRVRVGDTLAMIDSIELAGAKASLLQANTLTKMWTDTLERIRPLSEKGLVAQKDIIAAETSLAEARIDLARATQHLRNLGVDQPGVEQVLAGDDANPMLAVRAPFDGVVVERHAVLGENIDAQHVLFTIVDPSTMWVMLDVRESDLRHVQIGQRVVISVSGMVGETFAGQIAWVSAAVDPTTRTLKARADLPNAEGLLRANMFGKAQVVVSDESARLVVPRDAVQWDGCCNLVFVRQTDAIFQPFKVRLGADLGSHYVVEDGLRAGDEIVTDGAFLLKTELLRDSIGAGCCDPSGVKTD